MIFGFFYGEVYFEKKYSLKVEKIIFSNGNVSEMSGFKLIFKHLVFIF